MSETITRKYLSKIDLKWGVGGGMTFIVVAYHKGVVKVPPDCKSKGALGGLYS